MTLIALSKIAIPKNLRTIPGVDDLLDTPLDRFPQEDRESIQELAETISDHGLLNPITVKDMGGGKQYRLIAGYRRFKAMQFLGKTSIDAKSIKGKTEDEAVIQLVENVHRKDLNPLDIARSLEELRQIKGISKQSSLALLAKKSPGWVSQHMSLLKADQKVQKAVADGEMGLAAARQIAALPKTEQAGAVKDAKKEAVAAGKKKVSTKGARRQARRRKKGAADKQGTIKPVKERENEQKKELILDFISLHWGDRTPPEGVQTQLMDFWDFLMERNRLVIKP